MTWTYSGDPTDSAKDEIRFLTGDTNSADQQISDEEVAYILSIHPQQAGYANYYAAAMAARQVASKYTNAINKSVGSLSINLSSKREQWTELAKSLEEAANSGRNAVVGAPVLGGGGPTYLADWEFWDDHSP